MNRKHRRAAAKNRPSGHRNSGSAASTAKQIFAEAVGLEQTGDADGAVKLYKRLLAIESGHAAAHNNLGCIFRGQGKLKEASAYFARALTLAPQQLEQFQSVFDTLVAVLPPIGVAMQLADGAWPNRPTIDQLLGSTGLSSICDDPMLLCVLQSVPARNILLERLLTSLRLSLLHTAIQASKPIAPSALSFCCVLAKQCFINEYVFATTRDEDKQVDQLTAALGDVIASGATIDPIWLAAVAMYQPLHALPFASMLLDRVARDHTRFLAVDDVVTQQLREPQEERLLRDSIPCITPIEDETSRRVRQQYEENPYPRWVNGVGSIDPIPIDQHLRNRFPTVPFASIGKTEQLDILVPGCGTGLQVNGVAQGYQGARVLAVDLSLSSLCYAKRKTRHPLSERVDYFQGDILKLGVIGRTFDMIDCTGVLHHMKDPLEGWHILLTMLRPGGIMHLGFYSEIARQDVVAARAFIAERGYTSTVADIRRCRQDLLQKIPLDSVSRFSDFFSTSECRDLLFHVQESRMTIPVLKSFIDEHGLKFIGFDLRDSEAQKFRDIFAESGWSLTNLDRWHEMEMAFPNTFANMYQFWVQRD